jgi:hypothetical protein
MDDLVEGTAGHSGAEAIDPNGTPMTQTIEKAFWNSTLPR